MSTWRFQGKVPSITPCIMFMWHEELFAVLKSASHQNWIGIISASKDGNQLAKLITRWGFRVIRGSASNQSKAVKVLRETIAVAGQNKMCIGIDGPRGPRRQVKIGMLLAAQKTGVPVYLVRAQGKGYRLNKSWDKCLIPYPFAKITITASEPILVSKTLDRNGLETLGHELTNQLNNLVA
jgi:lysophospholipid acyltransferase (LPLAT)-like uncharacterized protein